MMKSGNAKRGWFLKIVLAVTAVFFLIKFFSSCGGPRGDLEIVRSLKVERGDLRVTVTATGIVQPYNRVEVKAPIAGRIEEVLVREGDEVVKGQVLARMSSIERAALLDAARSRGEEAVERWEEAYKPAPLLAPLDGTIIVRSVEPGQTVTTADPVLVLSDRLIVESLVDETDLAFIALGQRAQFKLDAYRSELFSGEVGHIAFESKLENNVNVYEIDVVPDEVPPSFRSGMTANVTFIIKDRENVLLVPSEAVTAWPGDFPNPSRSIFAVYRKSGGGRVKPIPIRTGESDGRMTEVTEGLGEGSEIVVVRKKERSQSASPFRPQRSSPKGGSRVSS
ncbi:MAG: macrolide transporter subunit MacA [Candidatus Omnitrophica bacterium ADurb.Bin277]|nr:MAG: macrolide transporter subunit MacA [Candidatus Omnitrophica bacterium ADurb.Bin277]